MTAADPPVFLLNLDSILLDINTLPKKTLLVEFARAGVDSAVLADELQWEGIQSFAKPWSADDAHRIEEQHASTWKATVNSSSTINTQPSTVRRAWKAIETHFPGQCHLSLRQLLAGNGPCPMRVLKP